MPEIPTRISAAHHSAQLMIVAGRETLRYSPHPRKLVMSGINKAGLIYSEQFAYIITETSFTKSLTELASASPRMSKSK